MAALSSILSFGTSVGESRLHVRVSEARLLRPAGALVAVGLVASAFLPRETAWLVALTVVIVLGVPHGALDGAVAAPLLRPRYGRLWFAVFAVPYLGLSALVLLAWQVAPLATLAGFLALSVLHFGEEDAGPGRRVEALVRGGLPIALPALLRPDETAGLFAVVSRVPMPQLPVWWAAAAWVWLAVTAVWLLTGQRRAGVLIEMALLALAFWILPPLTAFTLYFVGLHGPRHVRALIRDPSKAPGVDTLRRAVHAALPVFGLTLLLGAGLWPLYASGGSKAPAVLLTLTLQMLSALTVPHILLDRIAVQHGRRIEFRSAR
ncbi:Brp/Blh family beta-carotene 15,15'-dioxygenase [Methylobacterium pseudosasicola]|uniref:Probable beta-carotene 15,15'-dioxygenase n=1 Tax=Methylobacterium pseudosasicola TaxID=582667 RepID=A0A1I4IKQ1_9HYPH|nr:Brp/Blh family beta-carotene 15,15'-dioxygenase [Methylobacterium pseudosasicola]SFL54573.1 beta-carotene 15,15'-monooxygenase, Brp/Blh family [Methylobacterium pseudosasicola]